MRALRHVATTQEVALHLRRESGVPGEITVLVDANWAAGPSRRSTSGGLIYYGDYLLVSWSRTQASVALSSAEAELMALSAGCQEGQFVESILQELDVKAPAVLYSDSSAARAIIFRRGLGKLKHVSIRQLWLQDQMRDGRIQVCRVTTEANTADLLTKGLAPRRHAMLTEAVGVRVYDETAPEERNE